jgi:hypothetical protein
MSFLPSLTPGNVPQHLPPNNKYRYKRKKWSRPSGWLDLNVPNGTPEKIMGIIAVFPEEKSATNYLPLKLTISNSQSYSINWGDGNTETVASGTTINHYYEYDNITSDSSTTKATLFRGYKQVKFEITLPAGQNLTAIELPLNAAYNPGYTSNAMRRGANILDLFVSSSNCTSTLISGSIPLKMCEQLEVRNTPSNRLLNPNVIYRGMSSLQSIPFVPWIYNGGSRSYAYTFFNCKSLIFLPDDFADPDKFWLKNPNSCLQTFEGCVNLEYLPEGLFGDSVLSLCSSFRSCFKNCRSLRRIPKILIRTNSNVDFRNMFEFMTNLKAIPKGFDLTQDNNGILSTFNACVNLIDVSEIDLSKITLTRSAGYAFANWDNFTEFPWMGSNFNFVSNGIGMFQNSQSITGFAPEYTTLEFTNATNLRNMFRDCFSIEKLPPIHINAPTSNDSFVATFFKCENLEEIIFSGQTDGPNDGDYSQMFYQNYNLQLISGLDFHHTTSANNLNQLFQNTRSITAIRFTGTDNYENGFKHNVSLRYMPIDTGNMVHIFNHLVTVSHSATIDIRNTLALEELTDAQKAIATNKGWSVTVS